MSKQVVEKGIYQVMNWGLTHQKPTYFVTLLAKPTVIFVALMKEGPAEWSVFPREIKTRADWDELRSKGGKIEVMPSLLDFAHDGKERDVKDFYPIAPALQELCEYITEDAMLMVRGR
jgi:hypothetical protein